jgi:hypothetical protein
MVIYVYGVQFRLSKACVVLQGVGRRGVLLRATLSCSSKPVVVCNGAASRESTYSSLMRHHLPEGLRGGYASAKQNFQPHKTKNYCGYRSWNYH